MPTYMQADRPLSVTTPLGADELLLIALRGHEAISTLFRYEFELLAENSADVAFDKLLGQKATATIKEQDKESRFVSGIVSRVSQGARDETFTSYHLEIVPQFWLLTKRRQSRIFQYLSVLDILKKVLEGLDVSYEINGTFQPREYCVQYRESDFDFASRLMEEEGIYYFFKHTSGGHTLVLANTPQSHPEISPSTVIYEEITGGNRPEERILEWQKTQELRSGKFSLRDFSFELPNDNLEAVKSILDTVSAGTVAHKLKVGGNDKLELYDYPGRYANRFDGVGRGGSDSPSELQKIFQDNTRTVGIRMQEEATLGLSIRGLSSCPRLIAGYRFKLDRHFNADGSYVLTSVEQTASLEGDYRSRDAVVTVQYQNSFTCIPLALPFRPPQVTETPRVYGAQTALVVGPGGEEIFTDKYGRIKVQFPWDREGKKDGDSSCWVRVATPWAGKQWGMIHIPRIGQEVVVEFVDGDIDHPLVVGSVYNADQMPPYTLPANKTQSGIKTRSTLKGSPANFNEFRFEDKKGSEEVYFHAEKDLNSVVENNETRKVGGAPAPDGSRTTEIWKDESLTVKTGNQTTVVEKGNQSTTIKMGNQSDEVSQGNQSIDIKMGNQSTKLDLGAATTEAMQSITLKVGQSSIVIDQTGVTIKGMMISVEGQVQTSVKAPMTQVNGDAMLMLKGGITMIN